MQPFLILYFTPVMILKGLCDRPKQMEALASHEKLVKGWKNAVRRAELVQDGNYWPVRVNDSGDIEVVEPSSNGASVNGSTSVEITDAIVDSLDVSLIALEENNGSL